MRAGSMALASLVFAGCASQECVEPAERFCDCGGGVRGTQTCDHRSFGACVCPTPDGGPLSGCGDSFCDFPESAMTCPEDCGVVCGDGACGFTESPGTCPSDCPTTCGDARCSASESHSTCPMDCPPLCGDGRCDPPETPMTCSDCITSCTSALLWAEAVSAPGHQGGPPGIADLSGTSYIAWHDTVGDPPLHTVQLFVFDGLDPVRRELATGVEETAAIAVIASEPMHRVAVAWSDLGAGSIGVRIVDETGTLGTAAITAMPTGDVALLETASGFLVAWPEETSIEVETLDTLGAPEGRVSVPAVGSGAPALGFIGDTPIAAWIQDTGGDARGLQAAVLDPAGPIPISDLAIDARPGSRPWLIRAADPGEALAFVEVEGLFLRAAAFRTDGTSREAFVERFEGAVDLHDAVAWHDPARGGALVYAVDTGGGTFDLVVHELDYAGTHVPAPPLQVTLSSDERSPAVALETGTGNLGIAFVDATTGVVSRLGVDLCL